MCLFSGSLPAFKATFERGQPLSNSYSTWHILIATLTSGLFWQAEAIASTDFGPYNVLLTIPCWSSSPVAVG